MDKPNLIKDETGTQRLIGFTLDVSQPDKSARCYLTVNSHHLNRHLTTHGGIVAVLLDSAMGATASLTIDEKGVSPFLTISLNIQFISPTVEKMELIATGKVVGGGRSILFIEGEIKSSQGQLIATASGVFKKAKNISKLG